MSPYEVTLIAAVLVLGGYAGFGFVSYSTKSSYEHYFLSNRQLDKAPVRNTFAGATISIATVLTFFLDIGPLFGVWILSSPLSLVLGVLFFAIVIYPRLMSQSKLRDALTGETDNRINSLFDLIKHLYNSRSLGIIITSISGIGMVCILVAEMMVGVRIFGEFFIRPEIVIFLISISILIYAGFGGLASVVSTDKWQIRLIILSLSLITITLIIANFSTNSTPSAPTGRSGATYLDWTPRLEMPVALLVNILLVNLFLLPSSLRVWQVVVASSRSRHFTRGLWQSLIPIFAVVLFSLIIAKSIMQINDTGQSGFLAIFQFLVNYSDYSAYILYPLFVIALLSALMSTADSAVLPLAQIIIDVRDKSQKFESRKIFSLIAMILAATIFLFFVVSSMLHMGIVSWILTVFSISTTIAPVIIFPLIFPRISFSDTGTSIISAFTIFGFLGALVWSFWFHQDITMQPWNCGIGILSSILGLLFALAVGRRPGRQQMPTTA